METALFDLARVDHRYACEAYEFVCDAVTYTQERLDRGEEAGDAEHHVSGEELLRGGCELAIREFGFMAPVVFRRWGLATTDDFGEIVFRLIRADRLSQSENDDPADFHEVFDLMAHLGEGYDVDTSAYEADAVKR